MRTEIPVCKRCCFCLPLRYGLIVWGYLRLCISITLLVGLGYLWFAVFFHKKFATSDRVYSGIGTTIVISDFVLSLVLIVGCHKKNVKLMKMFYFYSQLLLGLTTAFAIFILAWMIFSLGWYSYYSKHYSENGLMNFIMHIVKDSMLYFAHLFLQLYMLLLVRSEIVKLNNGCQFRFLNHATEAQCSLDVNTLPIQRLHSEDNDTEAC